MDYILWKIPYTQLLYMLIDAPRYVTKKKASPEASPARKKSAVSFFQTKLNDDGTRRT